ncbi:MAG: sensor histidine kinase [[Eubacterium] brachy]|jgi:sensor histidine kinase|nr:sensor histidine kinase [[Eubacterium] brachy]
MERYRMYDKLEKEKFKREILPFYISLIFFVFPIYGIIAGIYKFYVLWLTIGGILSYIYLVHGKSRFFLAIAWICLLAYISYLTLYVAPPNILFMFYPTNIMIWKFNDKLISVRFISFFVVINSCLFYIIFLSKYPDKVSILIFYTLCFGTFFIQRKVKELDEIKNERLRHNAYINALLAENERNRISRDLHDTLGHIFVTLKVKSELAVKLIERGNIKEAEKELSDIAEISKKSMAETRAIVTDLRFRTVSDVLKNIGDVLDGAGISHSMSINDDLDNYSSTIQGQVSMILQEGVNNIIKHSNAKNVKIILSTDKIKHDKKIHIIIEDDGVGFSKITGEELMSLRERVSLRNGEIKIIHQKNPTKIKASLRIENMEKEEKLKKLEFGGET